MEMRRATNADGDAVRDLVFGILTEYGLTGDREGTDRDLDDIVGSYDERGGRFDVLESEDGRIVGCVGLYPLRDGVVELRKMYLTPECRGKGKGRRLLDHALASARALGFRTVELETNSRLVEAVKMYERYGFRPVHHDHLTARCDATYALELS